MSVPSPIEAVRAALAAAGASDDVDVSAIYLAVARASLDKARRELDALEVIVRAREAEAVRFAHGDAEQLQLGGNT
jgi:hypothetical protein